MNVHDLSPSNLILLKGFLDMKLNLGFKNIFNLNLLLSYKVITPYEIKDLKFQEDMYTTDITIKTVSFKRVALELHERRIRAKLKYLETWEFML